MTSAYVPNAGVQRFARLDSDSAELIQQLAERWRQTLPPKRPSVDERILEYWDGIVDQWMDAGALPLLIRKSGARFQTRQHPEGRDVVFVDNSPAHWCLSCALHGRRPTIDQIKGELLGGTLPVVFAIRQNELELALKSKYRGTQSKMSAPNLNKLGYKVCHIDPVGMNNPAAIEEIRLSELIQCARRLIDPRNMFLVPKVYSGLGELPEFRSAFAGSRPKAGGLSSPFLS